MIWSWCSDELIKLTFKYCVSLDNVSIFIMMSYLKLLTVLHIFVKLWFGLLTNITYVSQETPLFTRTTVDINRLPMHIYKLHHALLSHSSLLPCRDLTHENFFSSLFALTLTTYLTNSGNVGIRLALLIVLNLFLISLAISNLLGWMFWLLGSLANLSWNTTPVTCHHCFSVSCGHQVGWYESLEGVSDHEECCPRPEKPESGLAEEGGEPGPQYEYYVMAW